MLPDKRFFPKQWAWDKLRTRDVKVPAAPKPAPEISRKPLPPPDWVVAVIDSGINDQHEEVKPLVKAKHSVISDDTRDDDEHGTAIVGTLCGITGGAPVGATTPQVLAVKFCSQQVPPSAANAAKAIHYALDNEHNTKVIVLAWDCGYTTPDLDKAINAAAGKALIVVAAGNQGMDNDRTPNWPANYGGDRDHVITVMATDNNDERASFSNYGQRSVDIAAPGVDIVSAVPYYSNPVTGNPVPTGYRLNRGTSAATAHVARLAALILSQDSSWTPSLLKKYICNTARPAARLERYCVSGGIADYGRALS